MRLLLAQLIILNVKMNQTTGISSDDCYAYLWQYATQNLLTLLQLAYFFGNINYIYGFISYKTAVVP